MEIPTIKLFGGLPVYGRQSYCASSYWHVKTLGCLPQQDLTIHVCTDTLGTAYIPIL